MPPLNRLMSSSPRTPEVGSALEILMSAAGLTLLMIVMIEAAFLFW